MLEAVFSAVFVYRRKIRSRKRGRDATSKHLLFVHVCVSSTLLVPFSRQERKNCAVAAHSVVNSFRSTMPFMQSLRHILLDRVL